MKKSSRKPGRQSSKSGPFTVFVALALLLCVCESSAEAQNVIAWGNNQLTNVPPSATNVVAVAAGYHHCLALRRDGTVLGWGSGTEAIVPGNASNVMAIAAGFQHSLALRRDGTIVAWGLNQYGQLDVPAEATNVIAIAALDYHSLALRADGIVIGWRTGTWGPQPGSTNVIAISATPGSGLSWRENDDALLLFANGRVLTTRFFGAVRGFGADLACISGGPVQSLALVAGGKVLGSKYWPNQTLPPVPALASNVVLIAAGTNSHLAVNVRGELISWGINSLTNAPASATNLIAIATGPNYCLAVMADSTPPQVLGPRPVAYRNRISVGTPLPLFVRAIGSQPLHYQWSANGVPIPNTDTPFPQIPAELGTDDVEYRVTVSNVFGSVTSEPSKVSVDAIYRWGDTRSGQWPVHLTNVTALAAGAFHALALNDDGTVTAWGKNADSQTNVPSGLANVVAVSAGGDHSLVLRRDGSVVAWGRNWDGQTDVPAEATNVRAISAGWAHSLAVRSDGRIVAWGNSEYGQTKLPLLPSDVVGVAAGYFHSAALRSGGTVVTWGWNVPVPAAATNIVSIAAGWEHCLALRADGSVLAWGDNSYGQSDVPASATNVIAIAAGYYHNIVLRADGSVLAWGRNAFGVANVPPGLTRATCIAAGEDYSLALYGQGAPRFVQQPDSTTAHIGGNATFNARLTGAAPMEFQWLHEGNPVEGATNPYVFLSNVQAQNAGSYVLVASNSLGKITSEAANLTVLASPFIETNSSTPRIMAFGGSYCLKTVVTGAEPLTYQWQINGVNLVDGINVTGATTPELCISRAGFGESGIYSLAVHNTYGSVTSFVGQISVSTILAWGDNSAGQLEVPIGITDARQISAGARHNLLLRSDGTVLAWGDNSYGQGDVPESATNVIAVSAGESHSLALRQDGIILAWGANSRGQLLVPSLRIKPIAIAAGNSHNLALLSDATVVAWGGYGVEFWNVLSPTNVPASATSVIAIAAGGNVCMALQSDGSVVTWGALRQTFASATNVSVVAAGGRHALALRGDGVLLAWGRNYYGQTSQPFPPTGFTGVAAGADHSLGLGAARNVIAWGANYAGQCDVPDSAIEVAALSAGGAHSLALLRSGVGSAALTLELSLMPDPNKLGIRVHGLSAAGPPVIYTSENLVDWTPVSTNPPTLGSITQLSIKSPAGAKFYRVAEPR